MLIVQSVILDRANNFLPIESEFYYNDPVQWQNQSQNRSGR